MSANANGTPRPTRHGGVTHMRGERHGHGPGQPSARQTLAPGALTMTGMRRVSGAPIPSLLLGSGLGLAVHHKEHDICQALAKVTAVWPNVRGKLWPRRLAALGRVGVTSLSRQIPSAGPGAGCLAVSRHEAVASTHVVAFPRPKQSRANKFKTLVPCGS